MSDEEAPHERRRKSRARPSSGRDSARQTPGNVVELGVTRPARKGPAQPLVHRKVMSPGGLRPGDEWVPHPEGDNDPMAGRTARVVIDGHTIDFVIERQCKLCQAPAKGLPGAEDVNRTLIDMMTAGASVSWTMEYLDPWVSQWPAKDRPSRASWYRHISKHLPWRAAAIRFIVEERALARGTPVEKGMRTMIARGDGFLVALDTFNARVGAEAPKMKMDELAKLALVGYRIAEEQEGKADLNMLFGQFAVAMQVVRETLPPDQWTSFYARFEAKLQGMKAVVDIKALESEAEQ